MYTAYSNEKTIYEGKKSRYNKALLASEAREADFFKALFEQPIGMPTRPCPNVPGPPRYMGYGPDLSGLGEALQTTTPLVWAGLTTAN